MNVALSKPITVDQFLAWEEHQELHYEFDGFNPLAMTGGTAAHAAIQRNLIAALWNGLRGKSCQPYGSELKIRVAERIRYPDAFLVCTKLPPDTKVVGDPVVIFDVIGQTSITTDLVTKNAEYRATPSVQRSIVLQQDAAAACVFWRKGDDWVCDLLCGTDAILRMPEIGIEIALTELYVGLAFEPSSDTGI